MRINKHYVTYLFELTFVKGNINQTTLLCRAKTCWWFYKFKF